MDGKAGTVERGRNMKGLFIPNITSEMFRNGCLEGIEALMAEGEIYDIECDPSAQRWIPCSERLPEGITQVIIQTNGEAIHEAIYMGKDDYGHYVWKRPDNEIYWDEEVVAWMLLPTPYQPKEDICK